jgi:hypothetical protein
VAFLELAQNISRQSSAVSAWLLALLMIVPHELATLLATTIAFRCEAAQFFSATRMQTPDQRLCPSPGGGVLLKGITPKLFAAKGNRASR